MIEMPSKEQFWNLRRVTKTMGSSPRQRFKWESSATETPQTQHRQAQRLSRSTNNDQTRSIRPKKTRTKKKKTGQLNSLEEGQSDFFWKYDNQLSIYFTEQIKGWSTI